jgi:hypothetical protein
VVVFFVFVNITNFLKPFLHMNSERQLTVNNEGIRERFLALDVYTPSVGFAFGMIAYSSTLSQQIIVPELLLNHSE